MGRLKQHIIEAEEEFTDSVMYYYGRFLQACMQDHSLPNKKMDALDAIYWCLSLEGKEISRLQIEHIINLNTESLYESD